MNYKETIEYLSSLAVFGIRPGTERTKYASELLGNPHLKYKTIHVAGTNGKGSTTTFISTILKEAGYNVGAYTSPYVFKVNERIQYNLENISDEDFAKVFDKIKEINEILINTEYGSLTEFEAKTLGAFLYFEYKQVDYAVIEVGMGGRFDATNIIEPEISLITSIGLDHTEYLGDTIEKIAFEKAGIIKPNKPIISGANEEANKVIVNVAKENNSLCITNKDFSIITHNLSYDLDYKDFKLENIKPGLFGDYQFSNSAISAIACHLLGIDKEYIIKGIEKAYLPGRFERVEPNIIIDGAHNIDGANCLKKNLNKLSYDRLILVIGMLKNHSCENFIGVLEDLVDICVVTKSQFFRATPIDDIYNVAKENISIVYKENSVMEAINKAKEIAKPNDLILVTGSFYTIGEFKFS